MDSLRGMVSFVQTARSGSFVRAAQVLGVSAVAVSRNVARLEAKLGLRLFARTTRQLSLTAEGSELLARCETPLEQLDSAIRQSRDSAGTPEGRERVTAVSPFVRGYLMPSLGEFHARFPRIDLDIECSEQITELVAGRFDVGIRVGALQDASFVARPLDALAVVLCASPDFLARTEGTLEPAELARRHGLGLRRIGDADAAPWRLQGPSGPVALPVSGPLCCNDFLALMTACVAGLGVAQVPLVVALPELRAGRLRVVLPELAPRGLTLFVHYPVRQLRARVRVLVDWLLETIPAHPDLHVDATRFVWPSAGAPRSGRRSRAGARSGPAEPSR